MFRVFLVCQRNSCIRLWFSLELNTLAFLFFIKSKNEVLFYPEFWVKYYIIQRILSFFLLYFLLGWGLYLELSSLILLIKIGFPPFHSWFLDLINSLTFRKFFFLSTWQKIPFFFLYLYIGVEVVLYFVIFFFNLFSLIIIYNNIRLLRFLFFRRINFRLEFLVISKFFLWSSFLWLRFYFIALFVIKLEVEAESIGVKKISQNLKDLIFRFFVLSGFPPFSVFFFKYYLILRISNFSYLILGLYLIVSCFFIFFYLRVILLNFLTNIKKLNLKNYLVTSIFYVILLININILY